MPARPSRFASIDSIPLRLQLMMTYEQLVGAGVIRFSLPGATWDGLLLAASPGERVDAVLQLLTARQALADFRPRISDDIIALAIHEASPDQVNEFVFLVDWTPAVTQAIAAVTGRARLQLPAELEILQWTEPSVPESDSGTEVLPSLLLAVADPGARVALVDAYQCLWAYEIIDESLSGELLAGAFTHLLEIGDAESFNRLSELVPEDAFEHPAVAGALDAALARQGEATRPDITAPYTAIAPSGRWRAA